MGWGDGKGGRELGRRVFLPGLLPFLHSTVVLGWSLLQFQLPNRTFTFKFKFRVALRPQKPYYLKNVRDRDPRTATSTFTQLLSSDVRFNRIDAVVC